MKVYQGLGVGLFSSALAVAFFTNSTQNAARARTALLTNPHIRCLSRLPGRAVHSRQSLRSMSCSRRFGTQANGFGAVNVSRVGVGALVI